MKILYAIPDGIDLGGIITATEAHIAGLQEIGHEVTFLRLRDTVSSGVQGRSQKAGYDSDQWASSAYAGLEVHPLLGWTGPYYSMNEPEDILRVKDVISNHDLVIWGFLFGFKNKNTEKNPVWVDLFDDPTVPMITVLHDDHLWDRQAWIANLDGHAIKGWACVHHCSFYLSEGLSSPRALIFNGHDVSALQPRVFRPWDKRAGLFSVQNAKPWKKVDKFVSMSRFLSEDVRAWLAGDGIEIRYMRSKDRCKPQYTEGGTPIWNLAIASGKFEWIGPVGEVERNAHMVNAAFLCDFSTRKNKGMFNRTFVEAALRGCVTIANPRFMSGADGEARDLLRADAHYLPVDTEKSPKEIAEQINEHYGAMTARRYRDMQENLRTLCVQQFDRRKIAGQLVDLGMRRVAGFSPRPSTVYYDKGGKLDKAKARTAFNDMLNTFGVAFSCEEIDNES
mgnify:CR=1 FL=1